MPARVAAAAVKPVRQRTQYSCMSASMAMCLNALDYEVTEDEVNKVMGSRPMKGAAWEDALACAQHYGCRATLTTPATVSQLKKWTDAGVPVMIAWNPEGRDWSHASVVFDVQEGPEGRVVLVADPNIPNPEKTVREVPEDDFYGKWYEKWPNYLVRRPACAIDREVTVQGRQVVASVGADGWERLHRTWSKEYKNRDGYSVGTIIIDRGKVNWRPNQLLEGFIRPKVLFNQPDADYASLAVQADQWVRKNVREAVKVASVSRYCAIWKASNGKWYLDLASEEYGDWEDATTYGPFSSMRAAEQYLDRFSNPGAVDEDDSGEEPPPRRSPNGDPIVKPSRRMWARKKKKPKVPKHRVGPQLVTKVKRRPGAGPHHNRERDVARGHSRKPKYKQNPEASRVAERYLNWENEDA